MSLTSDYGLAVELADQRLDEVWSDGGATATWTDITSDVRALSIDRGLDLGARHPKTGQCRVVLNNSASEYDPDNSGASIYPDVQPGAAIRVTADTSAAATKPLFYGYLPGRRSISFTINPGSNDAVASWTVTDPSAWIGNYTVNTPDILTTLEDGTSGNTALGQITSVIGDLAQSPSESSTYTSGSNGPPMFNPPEFTGSALGLIQRIADSEGGWFFFDASGGWVYLDRYASVDNTTMSSVQGTLSDDAAAVDYRDGSLVYGWGHTAVTRVDVEPYPAALDVDEDFSVLYREGNIVETDAGDFGWTEATLAVKTHLETEEYCRSLGRLLLGRYSQVQLAPMTLTVKPKRSSTERDFVFSLDLFHKVTVEWTPPGLSQRSTDCFVTAIRHEISQGQDWVCVLTLQPSAVLGLASSSSLFQFDTAGKGFDQGYFGP